MTRVLVLHGGWPGHRPAEVAAWASASPFADMDVVLDDDLAALEPSNLAGFDLLCLLWTYGEVTPAQERALVEAVTDGLGLLAWHGSASAFLSSRPYKHLLGGQFVAHPGGGATTYVVRFADHPLTADLEPLTLTSEQYYVLVDPAIEVLATTEVIAPEEPWLAGVEMPVAWARSWGAGRVAYVSVGHGLDELRLPQVTHLLHRAARWAARRQAD